jgi:hypothetical protein
MCYGELLANGAMVDMGEAVGIVAARSIGGARQLSANKTAAVLRKIRPTVSEEATPSSILPDIRPCGRDPNRGAGPTPEATAP